MNGPTLWRHARLATLAGSTPWGWIERGALLVDGDRIAWVGAEADLPADVAARATAEHDLGGALVTPGLIDCHTHLVYAGQRAREFELRLEGASYEDDRAQRRRHPLDRRRDARGERRRRCSPRRCRAPAR